jgi:hypothetical protein
MITHHTLLIVQQTALMATLGAVPLENLVSLTLTATSALRLATALPLAGQPSTRRT